MIAARSNAIVLSANKARAAPNGLRTPLANRINGRVATTTTSRVAPICAATDEESKAAPEAAAPPKTPEATPAPATPSVKSETKAPLSKAREQDGTALVTGAISLLCGAGYLYLVSFFNQRGADMVPPPPEAFM